MLTQFTRSIFTNAARLDHAANSIALWIEEQGYEAIPISARFMYMDALARIFRGALSHTTLVIPRRITQKLLELPGRCGNFLGNILHFFRSMGIIRSCKYFMLHSNLPQNVTDSYRYLARQYPFPVFSYQDHVNFKVRLGISC